MAIDVQVSAGSFVSSNRNRDKVGYFPVDQAFVSLLYTSALGYLTEWKPSREGGEVDL